MSARLDGTGALRLSRRAFLGASVAAAWAAAPAKIIELPDVSGRIDHLSADVAGKRLFAAALGNRTIETVDIARGVRASTIHGVPEPQGVLWHAASRSLWAACRADGSVRVFDFGGKLVKTIRLRGGDADNIRAYGQDRIVVGHAEGALALFHATSELLGEIELGAHPESFQIEASRSRAYVNLPDRREIAVADLEARKVIARWPLTAAAANYPMALDEKAGRLYVACRQPARLLTIDTATGRVLGQRACVGDADDVFHDGAGQRTFVIGGAGWVDVVGADDRSSRLETATGARTGLWVTDWKTLVVAVPRREVRSARLLLFEPATPKGTRLFRWPACATLVAAAWVAAESALAESEC